ncbi:MAG: DUF1207 domain-containing protein [Flavobacteriales bacterium]
MKRKLFALWLILVGISLQAQETDVTKAYFIKRDFGNYFLSDNYAPITSIGIGMMPLFETYDLSGGRTEVVIAAEPKLGVQLPIYYYKDKVKRWSLSTPLSFSVWFDFAEERTSPILNTDYRFALLEFNYSRILSHSSIKNIGFRIIPFFHESTHIGDELIIHKLKDSIPVTRINVSYETFEIGAIINDPYNQKIKNHSARLGAKFLWNPEKGYYTADSLEISKHLEIKPSKRWIEPYVQYQYQNPDSWFSNKKMMFVFSQDLSLRVRYEYPFYFKNQSGGIDHYDLGEAYQLSSTTMLGWKFYNEKNELSNSSLLFKFYSGINPHGQFRNIPTYAWIGINWIYEF